jgi:DNA-binding transcriptional ArsR family regulator
MDLIIEYNKALELLFATYKYFRYATRKDEKEVSTDLASGDITEIILPSKQILGWMKHIDVEISPFLKNDLLLLYEKVPSFFDTYFDIIIENNLTSPLELIAYVKDMPNRQLIEIVFRNCDVEISYDDDNKHIFDALCKSHNEEIANIFIQIKKYPAEYKAKAINLFEQFYTCFVKPNEAYVTNFIEEKLAKHNLQLTADPVGFLNIIGIGDYSKAVKASPKTRIFISYYFDHGIFYGNLDTTLMIMYGFYMEERFNQQMMQDKYKNFFKALSDEKRLEIIRLTSKRPWYNKELADYFDLTTATLSYHLNLLLDIGILNFEPSDYKRYYYTTNKETLKAFFEYALEDLTSSV